MPNSNNQTPLLSMPYIQGAQAQKHVTHNEALELLDIVVQLTVEAVDAITPPSSAAAGQAWIVGAGATGAWSSYAGQIAAWRGGGWLFVGPQIGWRAWDKTNAVTVVYDGNGWTSTAATGTGGAPDLQNLDGVGINASSDATNKLAVAADATLLKHNGGGHQLKINKAGQSETASLLYQSGFSGRAEMGLAGNDDFSIKVSGDGATFTEALRIDANTGIVAMPATGTRQLIPFNYRYYLYTDRRWTGPSANPANLNAAQSLGTDADPIVDWDGKGLYIPAGSILHQLTFAGSSSNAEVLDLDLRIYLKHGLWNGSWNTAADTTRMMLHSVDTAGIIGGGGMCHAVYPLNYTTPADGYFAVSVRHSAASTLTDTQYFYTAGALEITLPPSV